MYVFIYTASGQTPGGSGNLITHNNYDSYTIITNEERFLKTRQMPNFEN